MSKVYTLSEMVDLALATPKIGVVNCFMLHALLHALIKRLDIGECSATILAKGDKDYPWTEVSPKFTESGREAESNVVVKVTPTSDDSSQEKSPEKNTGTTLERKPTKQEQSRSQADGDDAESKVVQKEPSSASRKGSPVNESESTKRKPSSLERSKSKRTTGPTPSSTRESDGPQESRGLQKEPSFSKKEAAAPDSEAAKDKKKASSLDRSKSKRGMSQTSGRDSDATKDPQGLQRESSPSKKELRSRDSAGMKKKPSSVQKSKSSSEEDSNGPAASPTEDDAVKETFQKSDGENGKESPTTEDQFGLPYLESGVSSLKDVRNLVKKLCNRMSENEKDIKRLKSRTSDSGKSKMERLNGKLSNMMGALGNLEKAVFGAPKADNDLDELSRRVDQMVEMSTALEDNVIDKILTEDSSDEGIKALKKKKTKKEKKYQQKPKDSSKEQKPSKPEPDSSESSDKEKVIPVIIKTEPAQEPTPLLSPSPLSSSPILSMEEAPSPSPPPPPPDTPISRTVTGDQTIPTKESVEQQVDSKHPDALDHLQKKVNMVLHLMCNLEKLVKDVIQPKGKTGHSDKEGKISSNEEKEPKISPDYTSQESSEKKIDEEKDKVVELKFDDSKDDQSEHSKQKQGQGSYQILIGRIKKLEDEMQKLHQIVSSDSSSSSNLTKMVGDFLSTISTSGPESETVTKKTRKEKRGKRKKKKPSEDSLETAEEKEGEEEVVDEKKEEVGGEAQHSEGEEEAVASGEEELPKEIEADEFQDIVIFRDADPEKLSDHWDQLKILADALRGLKCNVVSLEKNSKNMAKALQLLMRGNTNIIDEDFEIIGELKVVVRKLYSDYNNLNAMVLQDRNILLDLTVTVDNLLSGLAETKSHFAGKMENLRNTLIQKADRFDLDNMVSSVAKKLNISDYRREMDELKTELQEQDDKFKMDVQQLKNDKYDRIEMDLFRIWVECKLSASKKMPQTNVGAELYQDDGAILKKQIPFHCLSCDKNLLITPQPLIPPATLGTLPPTKRYSAISTNEGGSRLLKKRTQITQSLLKPADKVLLEGKDNKLYQGNKTPAHTDMTKVKQDEVTSRPGKEDPLPPLNGAVPSKSEHGLSRKPSKRKSIQSKRNVAEKIDNTSDVKSEA